MDKLSNFTAVIQLIAAVNFANILFGYHKKVFRFLFNISKIINEKFGKIRESNTVNLDSLRIMKPIKTTEGRSTEQAINNLRDDYEVFDKECQNKIASLYALCRNFSDSNWVKSFFLFISVYSVIDITLIATIHTFNTTFTSCILHCSNIIALPITFKYIAYIIKQKASESYKTAIRDSIIMLSAAITLSLLNSLILKYTDLIFVIPTWFNTISCISSILIPFFPCIFCFCYVSFAVNKLNEYVNTSAKEITTKSEELQARMKELNTVDKLFTTSKHLTFE